MDIIIANIFIVLCGITLLGAIALTAYSVWHSLKENRRPKVENGVPTRKIALATIGILLAIAFPTLLFGSFTDMCIITGGMMLLLASCAVIYSRIISITLRRNV